MSQIVIIGGGAAGMMAAIFAADAGAQVTLLERGKACGKKLRITGKGRCNVTNDCSLNEFLEQQVLDTNLQNIAHRRNAGTRRRDQLEELVVEHRHIADKVSAVLVHRIPLRSE